MVNECVIMVTIKLIQLHLFSVVGQLAGTARGSRAGVDDTSRVVADTQQGCKVNHFCVSLSPVDKSLAPN